MKKAVAFLLAFLIFVAPVTTLVKADVVIGDNDNTIINENANILGRKLALMESLSDLALSGITEFTISNTNDVDSYLDSLWQEVNDAIDSLSDGTGFTEISNTLKSKYFTNLVQYRDYINNRGDYLSYTLQNPTTNLLSTYFADNIFGKVETKHYDLALDTFRALSEVRGNNNPTPNPNPDYSFINNVNNLYLHSYDTSNVINVFDISNVYSDTNAFKFSINLRDYTLRGFTLDNRNSSTNDTSLPLITFSPILTINLYTNNDNTITANYSSSNYVSTGHMANVNRNNSVNCNYLSSLNGFRYFGYTDFVGNTYQYDFVGISTALNYIYQNFANINLYVDNVLWVSTGNVSSFPTLDIDGYIKIYGNDTPQQYQLQPNTKIDYDQLYQVIYNAIRDNLPISQGDINYYDSHDTIYSPTIINNYGEEEGEESDLIDTILDYAVIPKFDTAIAQPMRAALTNGVVIMQNSITNVIPDEILLILGACFFLLLFAVVINRMIK